MSNPQLPPYLGSWEELVKALLHNPFLGSGAGGPHRFAERQTASATEFPNPDDTTVSHHPPRPNEYTASLLAQVSLRQAATRLPKEQGKEIIGQIDGAIADEIDFICGSVPIILRLRHWPPPPPPWTFSSVAAELTLIANTLQEGGLRTELERVSGALLETGLKRTQIAPARAQEKKAA